MARNHEQEKQQIEDALKKMPEYFTLPVFSKTRCRVGHRMSHFFSEIDGVQLVVQTEQADGTWLDAGRNTPEFLLANLTPIGPRTWPISVFLDVPEQVLKDILCSAIEGGSNYWLCAREFVRDGEGDYLSIVQPADADYGVRKLKPFDAENFKPGFQQEDITLAHIAKGLEMVAQGALPKRGDLMGNVMRIQSDEHDFDASDADCILQLGFFGDVVYG